MFSINKHNFNQQNFSKLEIVSVCVDYSDFLELCIEQNKIFCDNYIIITSDFDKNTQDLCEKNEVQYIKTDVFYKNGAIFNKGAAINEGLKQLKFKDWLLFLDADTRLPDNFLDKIGNLEKLDKNKIYGTGRRFIWTYRDYLDLQNNIKNINDFEYIPGYGVGFFQLINYNNDKLKQYLPNLYPDSYNCNQVDIDFLKRTSRHNGLGDYYDLIKIDMDILCFGPHGIGHNGRVFSKNSEFRNNFKIMVDMRDSYQK